MTGLKMSAYTALKDLQQTSKDEKNFWLLGSETERNNK